MAARKILRAERVIAGLRDPCLALQALVRFAARNPGFDLNNYTGGGGYDHKSLAALRATFHADQRISNRGWCRVKEAAHMAAEAGVTDDDLLWCYEGRCTVRRDGDGYRVQYVAGQYWCTEFRHGAATLIESAYNRRLSSTPKENDSA